MTMIITVILAVFLLQISCCFCFLVVRQDQGRRRSRFGGVLASSSSVSDELSTEGTTLDNHEAIQLKDDLVALAAATRRGFSATKSDRDTATTIINKLSKYSPTDEPAAAYYKEKDGDITDNMNRSTLAGKWTLIYTDAPDITSLDIEGPFSTAKLGRIGQECNPPTIKNVIEWTRPDWPSFLPFSGKESSRVLQKVCCEGTASKDNPLAVDLKLVGLEISGEDKAAADDNNNPFLSNGPATLLENNPVNLKGPLSAPFGKFEILYLDNDMRITKTYQGFYAVNIREDTEWF